MSDWIKEAIDEANTATRQAEIEYAIIQDTAYRRLFPELKERLQQQIAQDVAAYNALFADEPTRQLREGELGGRAIHYQKTGAPPFGKVVIVLTRDERSISAMRRFTPLSAQREEVHYETYRLRLENKALVIETKDGEILALPELSRAILKPFFLAVT
jgi:hypothetical protein